MGDTLEKRSIVKPSFLDNVDWSIYENRVCRIGGLIKNDWVADRPISVEKLIEIENR